MFCEAVLFNRNQFSNLGCEKEYVVLADNKIRYIYYTEVSTTQKVAHTL